MPWKSLRMSNDFARDRSAHVFTDIYDEKRQRFWEAAALIYPLEFMS